MAIEKHKVLVTGGTGFVGSHAVDALLEDGHRVRCLVRATSNLRWLEGKPVEPVQADLRSSELDSVIRDVDAVIHCAGLTRGSSEALMAANRDGTRALLEACLARGQRLRFVFCSSQAAAGPGTLSRPREVSDEPAPTSDYGRSKLAAEGAVLEARGPLDVVVLRPVGVYGPRDEDTLPFFKLASRGLALTPGLRRRVLQLVHAKDVASALLKALECPGVAGKTYFVGHPDVISWRQLTAAFENALGRKIVTVQVPSAVLRMVGMTAELFGGGRRPGQIDGRRAADLTERAWTCNVDRTLEELGWSPTYDIAAGLRDSVAWYREEGWL